MKADKPVLAALRAAVNGVDLVRFRFWVQLASFAFFVYGGYAAVNLGSHLPIFACGYNRVGKAGAGVCYLMPLQHQLARSWTTLFTGASLFILTGLAIFALWFIALNKAWCGFVCPMGTIQDWITALRRFVGIRYSVYTQSQFGWLKKIKYLLLALAVLIPLGIGDGYITRELRAPICQICPGRVLLPLFSGDYSHLSIDFTSPTTVTMTALGVFIAGLFLVGSFVKKRFYCFFCPMSALQFLFSKLALLRLKKDGAKCTRCGDCYRVCDMQIKAIADDVATADIMADDCTLCLKCVAACPETGALTVKYAGLTIFESTETGFIKRCQRGHCRAHASR